MSYIAAFISIPKNASMSVRKMLSANGEMLDMNHCPVTALAREHNLSNLFTFCFSRCPYSRTQSWFLFHRKEQRLGRHTSWPYSAYRSFDAWVRVGMPHHWGTLPTPLLQTNFIRGFKPAFVGKVENFYRDMAVVVDELNQRVGSTRFRVAMVHENVNGEPAPAIETETRRLIHSALAEDFETFGYQK